MKLEFLKNPDGQSAIFFVGFGIATVVLGGRYRIGTISSMGPGFFPVALGALLTVVGLLVGLQALRACTSEEAEPVNWRAFFAVTLSILASAVLLLKIGLLVAVPVLVLGSSLADRRVRPIDALLTAAVLTAAAWAIFIWGLGLRIPLLGD